MDHEHQGAAAGPSRFSTLPFLTDAYLSSPHSAAAAQQQHLLFLQANPSEPAAAATDRLNSGATERWTDPNGAAAIHLMGAFRDGYGADLLPPVQDPSTFAASYCSFLCSQSGCSLDNSQGGLPGVEPRSFSPVHSSASLDSRGGSFVGSAPALGFPFNYGPSVSCQTAHLPCGTPEGSPFLPDPGISVAHKNIPTHTAQGIACEYGNQTRELQKRCANLRELVTSNPSSADELNKLLGAAIDSAGQVTQVQQKLQLSLEQQKRLIADGKLVQSKLLKLHEFMKKTCPQYCQLLANHPKLCNYLQQLEQLNQEPVGLKNHVGTQNISENVRSTSTCSQRCPSSTCMGAEKHETEHRLVLDNLSFEGLPLPVKSEPTPGYH